MAYRRRRGSFNTALRNEHDLAQLAAIYVNAHKGKGAQPSRIYEFAPHIDEPPVTLEVAMETWR